MKVNFLTYRYISLDKKFCFGGCACRQINSAKKTCVVFLCLVAIVRVGVYYGYSLFSLFYVTGECYRFQTWTSRMSPSMPACFTINKNKKTFNFASGCQRKIIELRSQNFLLAPIFWKLSFTIKREKVECYAWRYNDPRRVHDSGVHSTIYRKQLFFDKKRGLLQIPGLFDNREFLFLSKIGSIPLDCTPRKNVYSAS